MERGHVKIGIVGAGTMGAGLVQLFAHQGFAVAVVEQDEEGLERGMQRLQRSLQRAIDKNLFSSKEVKQIHSRIAPATKLESLRDCHLVIEAIFEQLPLKQKLFKELIAICKPTTILATNTSSFRLRDMGRSANMRKRLVGLHFFNPPASNRLVEVVLPKTVPAAARHFTQAILSSTGRVPIVCEDESAFVVNRFFAPWLNEAARMFDDGLGTIEQINALSKREFGTPLGAFELMNLTGLAPVFHTMETLNSRFGKAYQPAKSLRAQLKKKLAWEVGPQTRSETLKVPAPEAVDSRLRAAVFFSVGQLLQAKVCRPEDIDIGAQVGLKWQRGPLARWQALGDKVFSEAVERYSKAQRVKPPNCRRLKVERIYKKWHYVDVETYKGSALITLNRPEAMNALSPTLLTQLGEGVQRALTSKTTRRIILRGRGKTFAAGGDLAFLRQALRRGDFAAIDAYYELAQQLFVEIDASRKPVIAFVEGMAMGGGVQLALAADIIVANSNATFEFPESGLGLFPGLGGTQRLPQRIGRELTKYLFFTGERLDAATAHAIGLADHLGDDLDWHETIVKLAGETERQPTLDPQTNLPDDMQQIVVLMNSKNVSRLIHRKAAHNLPEEMQPIYAKTRSKSTTALEAANRLIDKSAAIELAAGLQLELDTLKQLIRSNETQKRLLTTP